MYNICFHVEIKKILWIPPLIWSYDNLHLEISDYKYGTAFENIWTVGYFIHVLENNDFNLEAGR